MYAVLAFVAVLPKGVRYHRDPDVRALFREALWDVRFFQIPKTGDTMWCRTLFPISRPVYVHGMVILDPDQFRPYPKFEIEFEVTETEFKMLRDWGWHDH